MRVAIILGTRPEIIKLSPIIRECRRQALDFLIVHTGQHYSYDMDRIFFEQLNLPNPTCNLEVGSGSHAQQTGKMLIGIEGVLAREKPDIVLVQGDTNTTLAGALAASKLNLKVAHIEAGLRSYDRRMPEEINRVLTDHLSDLLFAPTETAKENLLREGIPRDRIHVTGNTVVDAVQQNLELTDDRILRDLSLEPDRYLLATVHRQENVDNKKTLSNITKGLSEVTKETELPIVLPVHPRTRARLDSFKLTPRDLTLIAPQDYLRFLHLERHARLILTDSGGVQEEACILKVPCVTLRDNTERPETLDAGSNIIAGTEPEKILESTRLMLKRGRDWINPFGDGRAGEKIALEVVKSHRQTHRQS